MAKGDALEDLIAYLFELVPGVSDAVRKSRNPGGVGEIDLAFWNDAASDGLRQFDKFILVESKNWEARVGYAEIILFKESLESRGASFGIMVAASGVTGDAENRSAAHHALFAMLRSGREIVVLTRAEIEVLESTEERWSCLFESVSLSCLAARYTLTLELPPTERAHRGLNWSS